MSWFKVRSPNGDIGELEADIYMLKVGQVLNLVALNGSIIRCLIESFESSYTQRDAGHPIRYRASDGIHSQENIIHVIIFNEEG